MGIASQITEITGFVSTIMIMGMLMLMVKSLYKTAPALREDLPYCREDELPPLSQYVRCPPEPGSDLAALESKMNTLIKSTFPVGLVEVNEDPGGTEPCWAYYDHRDRKIKFWIPPEVLESYSPTWYLSELAHEAGHLGQDLAGWDMESPETYDMRQTDATVRGAKLAMRWGVAREFGAFVVSEVEGAEMEIPEEAGYYPTHQELLGEIEDFIGEPRGYFRSLPWTEAQRISGYIGSW